VNALLKADYGLIRSAAVAHQGGNLSPTKNLPFQSIMWSPMKGPQCYIKQVIAKIVISTIYM